MTSLIDKLKNKIKCPRRPIRCSNQSAFRALHKHEPTIDKEVYYHVECLVCGQQFSVEEKEFNGP